MELSKRLQAVADLVTPCEVMADIGTDHGYIPIYLVENQICRHAVAMDINQGPIERAAEHIAQCGFIKQIETRRSDGADALMAGEAQTVVIAGMGGGLVNHILTCGKTVLQSVREFILQPQSELHKVRAYLNTNHYQVIDEDMVEEDGKFYPMMKVVHGDESVYSEEELRFGRVLIKEAHPVLKQYLEKELQVKKNILCHFQDLDGVHIESRALEIKKDCAAMQTLLTRF